MEAVPGLQRNTAFDDGACGGDGGGDGDGDGGGGGGDGGGGEGPAWTGPAPVSEVWPEPLKRLSNGSLTTL
jgi:hypothetical protein